MLHLSRLRKCTVVYCSFLASFLFNYVLNRLNTLLKNVAECELCTTAVLFSPSTLPYPPDVTR